jgi:glycosyltransferase involved in cell wall biosynthesis
MTRISVGLSTNLLEPEYVQRGLDGIGVYTSVLLKGLPSRECDVQGWSFPSFRGSASVSVGRALPAAHKLMLLRDLAWPLGRTHMPADIFHSTDYRITRMDCPVVATLHDAIAMKFPEWYDGSMRSVKNYFLRKTVRNADHVIAVSQFSVAELVEYFGIDEEKITVVHNGVSSHWLDVPTEQEVQHALSQYGLRRGYFLFVGTLQPRKNIERILEAYLKLPPAIRKERQLVIVGRAGWRCDTVLAQIRGAQERGEQVVWLNHVAGDDALRRVYAGAGAFVFPSLHEGFGIPVAEAFACGVPVVTSNTTSLPEVSQGAALEIDPMSVGEIGDAMASLMRDDALKARCVAAGRQRASQLTWGRTVENTAAVYRAVLGR